MLDKLHRNIDYIRISITDNCNLRCIYCLPQEGSNNSCSLKTMSFEEIIKLCTLFVKLGITKIKITGGEPLVRKNCIDIIKGIKNIPGIKEVTLTTNGVLLEENMPALKEAGIDGINVSLDSMDENTFKLITRRNQLSKVLLGIDKALEANIKSVKINCIPISGVNDSELINIASLAKHRNILVRFIEMMPIGYGTNYTCIKENRMVSILEKEFGNLTPCSQKLGNGPSTYYTPPSFHGKIGFVSAVSHKFCSSCNRIRLTSSGFLKTCLQYNKGLDVLSLLRSDVSCDEILKAIESTILEKPESHDFFGNQPGKYKEQKNMSQIGG
ncbi:GTP 3',8-cyclase MoaA [Clostridium lacusfryxellense]|uniref:GTP 3',8-cyclase MoaA n=1 Tax=Clostridium lacusfryxellense TaxID=205328 RepID=UPI001C0B389F|nr:GTP 3',8-cyclase MoaA [Clostridium lacusfryxellense]MBU3112620.1 GTP 3',8-cyclase MoaA [Clostridium lacusfryxellense]